MSYRVKTVSQLTGIPRNTLVAWERRYQLLDPNRTEGGYRIYTDEEIAYLKEIKQLVDSGLSISESISQRGRLSESGPLPPHTDAKTISLQLVDHLENLDREGAAGLLRRVEQLPFEEAIQQIWLPFLQEVGDRWEKGELSVAQEHFCSGVAREHLLAMFRSLGSGVSTGLHVICASIPNELHDLPLLCIAVQLALRGWRVTWLGASVPVADLCSVAAVHTPDFIFLSSVVRRNHEEILAIGRSVLSNAPKNAVVVIGGGVQELKETENPRLWLCPSFEDFMARWNKSRKLH